MRAVDLIEKKKRNLELTDGEISFLINGYVDGTIPDYQVSAFLMAVYFNGMTDKELLHLTRVMADSGDKLDLAGIKGFKIDKHSSGGVGDKVTLVVAPLAAAAGLKMAKMSGRGLGHTGGTVDKLESIKGFKVQLTEEEFVEQVNKVGCAVIGQTKHVAVADKKLYALRDVTATVDSIPLIAASIMSKKLAVRSDGIILDVKVGDGAFMKTLDDAERLATLMVQIGKGAGRKIRAMVTDMSQPLGFAIGNALEVEEAMVTLKGQGPKDLTDLCVSIVANMLFIAGVSRDEDDAKKKVVALIEDGSAYNRFIEMIEAQGAELQGGRPQMAKAEEMLEIKSDSDGFITGFHNERLGICCMKMGAGRAKKDDEIDHSVGMIVKKKIGDEVKVGDVLATIHHNGIDDALVGEISDCFIIGKEKRSVDLLHRVIC